MSARTGRRGIFFLGMAAAWMALVWYLSSLSDPFNLIDWLWPSGDAAPEGRGTAAMLAHMGMFGVLAALLRWGFGGRGRPGWAGLLAFAATMLFALVDETHQRYTPGRDPALADLGFDAAGALIALGASWVGEHLYLSKKE